MFVLILGVGLFGTFTGFRPNASISSPKLEPSAAEEGSTQALLKDIRDELEEHEVHGARLHARLEELEAAL